MHGLKLAGTIVAVLLSIVPTAWAQAPATQPPPDPDVLRLMKLTGADKTGAMISSLLATRILQQLHQQHPDIPARAIDIAKTTLDDEFKEAFAPDGPLVRDLAAIWSRHFTHDEILGLIDFYQTPLGRKVVDATPEVARDAAQTSAAWAQQKLPELQKKIQDRLLAEGLIK